jgi:hypothetical protein
MHSHEHAVHLCDRRWSVYARCYCDLNSRVGVHRVAAIDEASPWREQSVPSQSRDAKVAGPSVRNWTKFRRL